MATIFEKLDNWEAGKYDIYLECARVLKDTFNGTILAALVIDDVGDDFCFSSINFLVNNGINSKYIDLSVTGFGDYGRFLKELSQMPKLEGILLDNIDRIPGNADTRYWEEFVRFALKKEPDFPLSAGASLSFDKMHVAARCQAFPEYLKDCSMQCLVISKDTI
jgi:hypothetical protein